MSLGARISKLKHVGHRREMQTQRCAVCLKSIRGENKSLLCSTHLSTEFSFNMYHQITKYKNKKWK